MTYELTNRLYAKKESRARDAVVVGEPNLLHRRARGAVRPCSTRAASPRSGPPTSRRWRCSFAPAPSERLQGDFRTEWDPTVNALRTIAANGKFSAGRLAGRSAGWSQRRFVPELPGFNDPNLADQYINSTMNIRGFRNRFGGNYSFNYDRQGRSLPPSALGRLLQLPVLRRRFRVPDLQPPGLVRADERHAGPPLQHLVHAGRHRHLLEPVRRIRRAAGPLMTAPPRGCLSSPVRPDSPAVICVEHLLERRTSPAGAAGRLPATSADVRSHLLGVSRHHRSRGGRRGAGGESPLGGLPLRRHRRRAQHLVGFGKRSA